MRNLFAAFLLVVLGLSGRTSAQCSPIPGTGCPGQNAPVCGTPPMIGTNFIFRCAPSCFPSVAQSIIIGTPLGTPLPLPAPPMCAPGCFLGCQPIVVLSGPGATLAIPPNPALIGLQLCIQCACQPGGAVCLNLTQATLVVIQ